MSDEPPPPIIGGPKLVVAGVELIEVLYSRMPKADRLQFANQVLEDQAQQETRQLAAARHKRRERFRMALTLLLLAGIVVDALTALYFVEVSNSLSWDQMKDWLSLALAPMIAALTAAVAFWYPTRETD